MTVRELIEPNQMIVDIEITVRKNGNALLDQLNFGPSEGVKPPYPMMVPIDERYIGAMNRCHQREASVGECREYEQKPILDKIRAEIEQKCCITVGQENEPAITLYDVFQIIDKYKAESEVQE